ncbi:MAG: hypothetical protein HY898_16835 [Deltaproteobacteria bacterium]|nr:hypothetical protein [Deltaproteobacteria bacterium]
MARRTFCALAIAVLAYGAPALAQHAPPPAQHGPPPAQHGPLPAQHGPGAQRGPTPPHGPSSAPHGPSGAQHPSAEGEHGPGKGAHHADPNDPPKPINWYHGFIGKKEGVEPSLLWRRPDEDAPYLAAVLNFLVFAWILVKFGKKPLQDGLTKRKEGILRDIEAAQKMRDEAQKRLKQYEKKLDHIDKEIERIRTDFREQGERDKQRIIKEAEEKRERMLKDASFLIDQEVKQMRVELLRETVDAAVKAAEEVLRNKITADDHDRLAEQFLKQLAASRGASISKVGSA